MTSEGQDSHITNAVTNFSEKPQTKRKGNGRPEMNSTILLAKKPIALLAVTLGITIFLVLLSQPNPSSFSSSSKPPNPIMARSFVLWLHGLGDSGPANEPIKTLFTSPEFRNTLWSFPSAPSNPVSCNCKFFHHQIYLLFCF